MAESTSNTNTGKNIGTLECAICLQICIHPTELPCGHIFCFLCVKGIANQSKKCAMCRQEIPRDYLDHPKLLDSVWEPKETVESLEGGYQWFYEGRNGWWKYDERTNEDIELAYKTNINVTEILICGELYVIDLLHKYQYPKRNPSRKRYIKRDISSIPTKGIAGWWQYDERTSQELEHSYKAGERTCELLIAGFLYVADFDSMVQRRRNDPAKRRRIKRDLSTIPKKGIAGIKLTDGQTPTDRPESPSNTTNCPTPPVTPADMPQTPVELNETVTLDHESLQSTIEQMQNLNLLERDDNSSNSDDEDEERNSNNMYIFSRRYLNSYRHDN